MDRIQRAVGRWAASGPKDIGLQTEDVLTSGELWDVAAASHFAHNDRAAGNGALMRATTSGVFQARATGFFDFRTSFI